MQLKEKEDTLSNLEEKTRGLQVVVHACQKSMGKDNVNCFYVN